MPHGACKCLRTRTCMNSFTCTCTCIYADTELQTHWDCDVQVNDNDCFIIYTVHVGLCIC